MPSSTGILTSLICLFALSIPAHAGPSFYSYHPASPLALGKGLSPDALEKPKLQCVKGTPSTSDTGAITSTYDSSLVFTAEQLKEVLKIDAKIDASYLAFSGSASFNYKYSNLFNSNSLTFVIRAESEFKPIHLLPPHQLEDFAQKIIDNPGELTKAEAFYRACGTHLAVVERRGASVSALLTVRGMSQQERTEIAGSVSGGANFGVGSVSASVAVSREIERAAKSGRLEVKVLATGGGGIDKLGQLVEATLSQPDTAGEEGTKTVVAAIGKALRSYLESAAAVHAAPLGFHVEEMRSFLPFLDAPSLIDEQRRRRTVLIVEKYRELDDRRQSALSILSGADPRSPLLDPKDEHSLKSTVTQIETYLDRLAELHGVCRDAAAKPSDCAIPAEPGWSYAVPSMPAPPRAHFLVATDNGTWDPSRSAGIVEGGYTKLIERVRVLENEANSASLLLSIVGEYLETAEIRFVPDAASLGMNVGDGQLVTQIQVSAKGDRFTVATSKGGPQGLLANILAFQGQIPAGTTGEFVVALTDKLKRKTKAPVVRLQWFNGTAVYRLVNS